MKDCLSIQGKIHGGRKQGWRFCLSHYAAGFLACLSLAGAEHARAAYTVTTGPATTINATSATVEGTVSGNFYASIAVEYGIGNFTSYRQVDNCFGCYPDGDFSPKTYRPLLSPLQPNTTYQYRFLAEDPYGGDPTRGATRTFTTRNLPNVTTDQASVIQSTSATLNATVNPNGLSTEVHFQYGDTTSYGNTTPSTNFTGTSAQSVPRAVTGLTPATRYYFRAVAKSGGDTVYGSRREFVTLGPPEITSFDGVDQQIDAGGNVEFSVTATGTPPLSYQWHRESGPIEGKTNAVLTLENLQYTHDYHVEVSNQGGAVSSDTVRVTVIYRVGEQMSPPLYLGVDPLKVDPGDGPPVAPTGLTGWDAGGGRLYATSAGTVSITWTNDAGQAVEVEARIRSGVEEHYLVGQPIIPPPEASVSVTNPPTISGDGDAFWHGHSLSLYATKPGFSTVHWKTAGQVEFGVEVIIDWPDQDAFQVHLLGGNPVDLSGNDSFLKAQIEYQEPGVGANGIQSMQWGPAGEGRAVLLLAPAPSLQVTNLFIQLVEVMSWTNSLYYTAGVPASIGEAITNTLDMHDFSLGSPYTLQPLARYCTNFYDPGTRSGSIIPVNTDDPSREDDDMDLLLYQTTLRLIDTEGGSLVNSSVAWPVHAVGYDCSWPSVSDTIFIGSSEGSGEIFDSVYEDWDIYLQNQLDQPGANPNDEHAFPLPFGGGEAIYALRDDLGVESEPYVLMTYRDPSDGGKGKVKIFEVVSPSEIRRNLWAGYRVEPPYPLGLLATDDPCQVMAVSGPYWQDLSGNFWARHAGHDGGAAEIVMRFYYPMRSDFYFPGESPPGPTDCVPWLSRKSGSMADPEDVYYTVTWNTNNLPRLFLGETLVEPKRGLPSVDGNARVEILYDQSATNGSGPCVHLIDPVTEQGVDIPGGLPAGIRAVEESAGVLRLVDLPPHLRDRLTYYMPPISELVLDGRLVRESGIKEPDGYLLLNALSEGEKESIKALSDPPDESFNTVINGFPSKPIELNPDSDPPTRALTAGAAKGAGLVTLAIYGETNNAPELYVIEVGPKLYTGELKVIFSENPFDEKLTLKHSGDFGGHVDDYAFQWRTVPAGQQQSDPDDWPCCYVLDEQGKADVILGEGNLLTLGDNYFICRFRSLDPSHPAGTNWSQWTYPQLAEGWIKRVLANINPFEQTFSNYEQMTNNTIVQMLALAGPAWEGDVPLNAEAAAGLKLIEIYETILNRGIKLSIGASEPVNYGPANDALLNAVSRISDLYMVFGNEAFADASDPTIGFGTSDGQYGTEAASIHCFQNQVPSLLAEELALLRGRDDGADFDRENPGIPLPSVQKSPVYNRLIWNFTRDFTGGEVAYALNYNIQGVPGDGRDMFLESAESMYPQGHGDAWGHYLTAIKGYYQLLRNANFTWVPRSEEILLGGQPVRVDYQEERKFAKAAAARARTGAEIVNLTYRERYSESGGDNSEAYEDPDRERAWGVSDWASRAGQGAYFDWVMGNALLPDVYRGSFSVTETNLNHALSGLEYNLTDDTITNDIIAQALGMSMGTVQALIDMPVRLYVSRSAFLSALQLAIGEEEMVRHQFVILSLSQTQGISEMVYQALAQLENKQFPELAGLQEAFRELVGDDLYSAHWESDVRPYVAEPAPEPPPDLRKIDRSTMAELREIRSHAITIQSQLDNADIGLNPLGLAKQAVPFDISPGRLNGPEPVTHFEQIYERAESAMVDAIQVFNHANSSTQNLRRQADTAEEFAVHVRGREQDLKNRLIEVFGNPFSADPDYEDHDGPDLLHYNYVNTTALTGQASGSTRQVTVMLRDVAVSSEDGNLQETNRPVEFNLSTEGNEMIAPASWGTRGVPGSIQTALSDMIQARFRFQRGLKDYENMLTQIEDQAALLWAQHELATNEIKVLNASKNVQEDLNQKIKIWRIVQLNFRSMSRANVFLSEATAEFLPTAAGMANDVTAPARGAIRFAGAILAEINNVLADAASVIELDHQNAKESVQAASNIQLTTLRTEFELLQKLAQLEQLVRQEAVLRLDLYNLQESLQQAGGRYLAEKARGFRILEERTLFRQQTASQIQKMRYKDMAFRIFRNDALQKYRAQFDLAAMFVYLAAKAYDYETCLADYDPLKPDNEFMNQIISARTLGSLQTSSLAFGGDPGLSEPLLAMKQVFGVGQSGGLKTQLGFNNPQTETTRFSLAKELFRNASLPAWQEALNQARVPDFLTLPVVKRFCIPPDTGGNPNIRIPALVIRFPTTIMLSNNFFGRIKVSGDSHYSTTRSSTKIRSVGVWFSGWNALNGSPTPNVYLFPAGSDYQRTPSYNNGDRFIREWNVVDQLIPISGSLNLNEADWSPWLALNGNFVTTRQFATFRAWHDSGNFAENETDASTRLVGRSVWNSDWVLVIPEHEIGMDLDTFIYGKLRPDGRRTGVGVADIKIFFQTYSFASNR